MKKKNNWKELDYDDIPRWVMKSLRNSPHDTNYYKGKTFLYKALKIPGDRQGEYYYEVYRKFRRGKFQEN